MRGDRRRGRVDRVHDGHPAGPERGRDRARSDAGRAAAPTATLGSSTSTARPRARGSSSVIAATSGPHRSIWRACRPRPVHVRLQLEGYAAWERSIDVRAGGVPTCSPRSRRRPRRSPTRARAPRGARTDRGARTTAARGHASRRGLDQHTHHGRRSDVGSRLLGTTPIGGVEIPRRARCVSASSIATAPSTCGRSPFRRAATRASSSICRPRAIGPPPESAECSLAEGSDLRERADSSTVSERELGAVLHVVAVLLHVRVHAAIAEQVFLLMYGSAIAASTMRVSQRPSRSSICPCAT